MALNVTFNNISVLSVRSDLLEEETVGHGKNGRPVASHWQTLLHVIMLYTWYDVTRAIGDILTK
jgi:hypothetical protein